MKSPKQEAKSIREDRQPDYEALVAAHDAQLRARANSPNRAHRLLASPWLRQWDMLSHAQRVDWIKQSELERQNGARGGRRTGEPAAAKSARKVEMETQERKRRRRIGELHPDRLGREQSAEERKEFTDLMNAQPKGGALRKRKRQ